MGETATCVVGFSIHDVRIHHGKVKKVEECTMPHVTVL